MSRRVSIDVDGFRSADPLDGSDPRPSGCLGVLIALATVALLAAVLAACLLAV